MHCWQLWKVTQCDGTCFLSFYIRWTTSCVSVTWGGDGCCVMFCRRTQSFIWMLLYHLGNWLINWDLISAGFSLHLTSAGCSLHLISAGFSLDLTSAGYRLDLFCEYTVLVFVSFSLCEPVHYLGCSQSSEEHSDDKVIVSLYFWFQQSDSLTKLLGQAKPF